MPDPEGSFICFFDEKFPQAINILVGGFLIPKARLFELDSAIVDVKRSVGLDETDPIKWYMGHPNCSESLRKMGPERVPELKRKMFEIVCNLPIKILMSFLWIGNPSNQVEAWKWAFNNILQRLSIILDRKRRELERLSNYPFMDVVFDNLPNRGKLKQYFDVYRDAYINGFQLPRGPLPPFREFKACPCLVTASCLHSLALQLTDFLVGATGDFFSWCYRRRNEQSVRDHFCSIYPAFHKSGDNKVLGYGLIVKSTAKGFVRTRLQELDLI
jgi:hypothetical protein